MQGDSSHIFIGLDNFGVAYSKIVAFEVLKRKCLVKVLMSVK